VERTAAFLEKEANFMAMILKVCFESVHLNVENPDNILLTAKQTRLEKIELLVEKNCSRPFQKY